MYVCTTHCRAISANTLPVGYPGGAILPVFDAIYNSPDFHFILPKHEQGAGHMAEGYARASGRPGVVLVTSGPGATNVVTPMADALADGVPLIVFTGQVRTTALGSDAFQEADVLGISRGCTKWNVMVRSVAELPRRIDEAFAIATSGRPGPVLVDLPSDVTASVLRRAIPMQSSLPSTLGGTAGRDDKYLDAALQRAAKMINNSKRPVIYAGHGVVCSENGPALLKALADKSSIPVTTSLHGLGAFDELDDKALHMLGMHGAGYANMAVQNADVIIALGGRFDERAICNVARFAPAAHAAEKRGEGGIIHFEIMPKNINKVVQATEAIEGDVGTNLTRLLPHITSKSMTDRQAWHEQIRAWKAKWPFSDYDKTDTGLVKPQALIETLSRLTAHRKDNTYITTGVGQHQMWAAQHFRWRHPRSMISSGGLGTMGFGLPAAIGAQAAHPSALVIDVDGDASLAMTLSELSTAAQFSLPVKVIVLNNEEQGMITQWQNLFYEDRYAHCHQTNPDFVGVAEAMGLQARRLAAPADTEAALAWLIDTDGPALLEVKTESKVPVLPMVPGGAGLDEFIAWDETRDRERRERLRARTGGRYG